MAMPISKLEQQQQCSHYYTPIPCQHDDNYVVLQPLDHHRFPTIRLPPRRILIVTGVIFLLISVIYLFWPSDPTLKIVRLRLNKLHIHTLPIINIDVSLHVTVKVRNVDVYSMDFTHLDIALRYRGKRLGHVRSGQGHVRALASSYVDAELEFSGVGVLSDVVFLLEDLARGKVPFDTVTKVDGKFGFLFFGMPLKDMLEIVIVLEISKSLKLAQW
ncbi:conserved hypothetical protein [Ricinus communis]|uniref:Late embryogenesis abundant protein LEA-2 subgroup domain-containing protein n=1 Tax=Ricinus communis TaxID=3988 RepID=B9RQQ8_RICCO|nr:conserved hypothetical protein [Ricinus communis]